MKAFKKTVSILSIATLLFFSGSAFSYAQTVTGEFGQSPFFVTQSGATSAVVMNNGSSGSRLEAFNLSFLGTTTVAVSGQASLLGKVVIFYSSGTPNSNCPSFESMNFCLNSPNFLSQVTVDTTNNCYGINQPIIANTTACTVFLTSTPQNATWGSSGIFGDSFDSMDVAETLQAGVQNTGASIWPLLVFSGVSIAFIIFLQVVFLTQKSVKPEKKKKFDMVKFDKKADELEDFFSKTGNASKEDLEVIKKQSKQR